MSSEGLEATQAEIDDVLGDDESGKEFAEAQGRMQ